MKQLIIVMLLCGVAAAQAPAAPEATAARKACTDAMNADPTFAKSIVDTVIDQRTLAAHQKAAADVEENKQHVIYAYGAMWIIAALFVGFLWLRQQRLKAEIALLRRDLDAAAKELR